jgi:hypothetical protein
MDQNKKYEKEIEQSSQELNDLLYQKTRQAINNGKPLPYAQYLKYRSFYWLNSVAEDKDLTMAQDIIHCRKNGLPAPSHPYP